jgi:hypothetical protein
VSPTPGSEPWVAADRRAPALSPPRLDVFLCGGSQLAGSGLPVTAALPVRLARGLRAGWGGGASCVHPVYCDVDPGRLADELALRARSRPFVVVLIPRNVPAVLGGLGDAVRRLVAADLSLPAVVAPPAGRGRWARLRHRWTTHAWYVAWLLSLPVRLSLYAARLERSIARCRRLGCALFVLGTPVPYPRRLGRRARTYQRLLAALIRWRDGRGLAVGDLSACLAAGDEPTLPDDPHHLTPDGHDRAARELAAVILRLAPTPVGPVRRRPPPTPAAA